MATLQTKLQSSRSGASERQYTIERVGPARIVQLYADGFDQLSLKEKAFSYYIYLAGIAGRDIAIDQHHPQMLEIRNIFEQVYANSHGISESTLAAIQTYLKLFWINNGFYDHLTSRKFTPECTLAEFRAACEISKKNGAKIDFEKLDSLGSLIFDPAVDPIETNKTPEVDWIKNSSVNYYEGELSYTDVDSWAKAGNEQHPLNSTVVLKNGKIEEHIWRAGGDGVAPGKYAKELSAVIGHLEKAIPYAASEYQAETVRLLCKFLRSGEQTDFRAFNIHWVKDSSKVDFILGFIEVYLDPRGQKGEFEACIYYTDPEQTKLMQSLASFAQYFEDKAPWRAEFKKRIDRSPIANVINVILESGGTGPVSPIGVNLPNEQAIRQEHGSKSILLHNVVEAYDKSNGKDLLREFAWDAQEIADQEAFGSRAENLHTAMHEVIGHGSGKASEKLGGKDPSTFFPGYYSTLEEARADLVALWNAWDPKLVEIGLAKDAAEAHIIGETMYRQEIRGALTQLRRLGKNTQIEEDHMKDRALIAGYIMANSDAVAIERRDGKTFWHVVDFVKMREAVGMLLSEIMRIKAEGDLAGAKNLIDTYGLNADIALRDEVIERVKMLDVPAYTGFVMPKLDAKYDPSGELCEVTVSYPLDLAAQMLEYSAFTSTEHQGHPSTNFITRTGVSA